jgi:Cu(I)/Ag(I) efflux system periplasmic protein CusF
MNAIAKFLAVSACAIGIASPLASFAQVGMDHSKMESAQAPAMTAGEIRKIDQSNGKVTIKHGDIQHLDMPGMTMVFTAKDKGILSNLKAGDQVKFMVISEGGKMIVTEIQVNP